MKIYLPANAIIIPITRDGKEYHFFLDSGFPHSFSKDLNVINNITNTDIHVDQRFNLPLNEAPIDISDLSQHLMTDLTGFLGMDFISQFDNFKINFSTKEIDFNVSSFKSDLDLNLVSTNPWFGVELSIDSPDNFGKCLVDTGTYQSLFFNPDMIDSNHSVSSGWLLPSVFGMMNIDFYSGIKAQSRSGSLGSFVFGCPTNLPQFLTTMPFNSVMGLNVLSQYECCFNLRKRLLQLRKNPRDFRYGSDFTEDIRTVGIQVISRDETLYISNILPGFPLSGINLNDKLKLQDIDLTAPEAVNRVCEALSSTGCEKDVIISVNGVDLTFRTSRLFR